MINQDYKTGKIIEIIREWDNTGDKYEVNGINKALAVPFFRYEYQKFQVIPKGSYRFVTENNNEYIQIVDTDILDNAVQFQMVYIYTQESSKYIEDFPNINILTEKYNKLVDDTTNIFGYLKSVGITGDTDDMSRVLPKLAIGETWYMNEDGILASLPVTDFWERINELIERVYSEVTKLLEIDYKEFEDKIDVKLVDFENKINADYVLLQEQLQEDLELYEKQVDKDIKEYLGQELAKLQADLEQIQIDTKHILDIYTDFKKNELDEYINDNRDKLKGDKGDKGDTGRDGANGITIPLDNGRFAITVEGPNLVMYYEDGTIPPRFTIENGQLVQII